MPFFKRCEGRCGKWRVYVAKRRFLVPKVSSRPITTEKELCGRCHRRLKRAVDLTK